jgi:hypothetical protein
MRFLFSILVVLMLSAGVFGLQVVADADGFGDSADISGAFSGVVLSSVGGYSGVDGKVYAYGDGYASTGVSVFANGTVFGRQWWSDAGGFGLRADFSVLANNVSIDVIGDDAGDVGEMRAYDSGGGLLSTVYSGSLAAGEVFNLVISRSGYDVAYIVAGGSVAGGDTVHLDNLCANVVPEPLTVGLLGVGAILGFMRKKRG